MNTRRVIAVTSVVAVGLLPACGRSTDSTPDSSGHGASTAAGAACDGKIDGPVTITIATHANNDTTKPVNPIRVYQDLITQFNAGVGKAKGITAQLVSYPETAYEKGLTAALQSGKTPDVVEVDAPFVGSFAYNQVIRPLGNCAEAGKLASLIPSVVANGKYRGQQYTLGAYDGGMGLWASKKALTKVGVRVPKSAADAWTVTEFDKVLKDLKAAGYPTPLNIEWGYGAGEWRPYGFGPTLLSAGSGIFKPDYGSAEGALNSPKSVEALTWFQQWSKASLIDLSLASGANDTNFLNGASAISWVGSWMGGTYAAKLKDDLVLLPLPNFGTGSKVYTGSWSFGMAQQVKDPDAAWALIDFLTGAQGSQALAESESAIPAVRTVLDADPAYQPGGQRHLYAQNLNDPTVAFPRPLTPAYLVARDQLSTAFADIIGGADVQKCLDKAAAKVDADIKANRGYSVG
ncbi:MAG TPA: extracellular solute-binding protein [Kineosporiaceae bacterium]|nr:extracellular solute-binding protein [Kineosporiaceae bacterium]